MCVEEKRPRRASLHMSVGDGMVITFCEPGDGRHSGPPPETMFVVADVSGQTRDRTPACGDLIFQVIGVKGTPLLLATPVVTPPGRVRLDVATAGLIPFEVEPVYVALVTLSQKRFT